MSRSPAADSLAGSSASVRVPSTPRRGRHCRARELLELWRDPIGFFCRLQEEQGDFAHVKIGWSNLFLVNHPDLVNELLAIRHCSFGKGKPLKKTGLLLGEGLLTSEGDFHHRQRRLIQPAFHSDRIQAYAEVMASYAIETQATWRPESEINITSEMMRLAQRIVAKSLFDTDIETAEASEAGRALDTLVRGFGLILLPLSEVLLYSPLPAMARLRRARRRLDRLIFQMIEDRISSGDRGDVLSMLLFAEAESGGRGMSTQQVRDEAMTLFLAGHDTTGNGLAWTWYLLARHPAVAERWHHELDEVLGGRTPTSADVPQLQYTRQIFAESMRLFPPVPAMGRRALEQTSIGGHTIPRGSIVEVSQWLLHRDPRFFLEPDEFQPERWTREFETAVRRGAYLPFGLGPRLCIGMQFAWMTGVIVLATLGQRWSLSSVGEAPVEFLPRSITLRPRKDLHMRPLRRPATVDVAARGSGRRGPGEDRSSAGRA